MKFSLVLATIGRTDEVGRFLTSLAAQTHRDFELIIVDQNMDQRLDHLLASFADRISLLHLHCAPGLSRARNIGLTHITGDVIAFPDDDCWYPPELLSTVAIWLDAHTDHDGVTGQSRDGTGQASQVPWPAHPTAIDNQNVWRQAISYSIFLRRHVVVTVGDFDESLGVGAGTPWGSGEETDYLLRALATGARLDYEPTLFVFHPQSVVHYDAHAWRRGYNYGAGMGRVLRKHHAPSGFVLHLLLRAIGGAVIGIASLRTGMARFHWNVFKGRLCGWLS